MACTTILACILPMVLLGVLITISYKSLLDFEKSSPYECGFDPFNNSRVPFSMRFYLICILFVVFDMEIVLMFPFIMDPSSSSVLFFFFMTFLFLGLMFEWYKGALDWK